MLDNSIDTTAEDDEVKICRIIRKDTRVLRPHTESDKRNTAKWKRKCAAHIAQVDFAGISTYRELGRHIRTHAIRNSMTLELYTQPSAQPSPSSSSSLSAKKLALSLLRFFFSLFFFFSLCDFQFYWVNSIPVTFDSWNLFSFSSSALHPLPSLFSISDYVIIVISIRLSPPPNATVASSVYWYM